MYLKLLIQSILFLPLTCNKNKTTAIYTILVYTAVQKTGVRECYDELFWNTAFVQSRS